jgi:hypothetical protein
MTFRHIFFILPLILTNHAEAGVSAIRCDGGQTVIVTNGVVRQGRSSATTFFGYDENGLAMTFSAQTSDPRDLTVKKGAEGQTYNDTGHTIEATLMAADAVVNWIIDKNNLTVKWSLIGRPGTKLENTTSTTDYQCFRIN